jgi:single-stranded-DNA-specific exonuclease
MKFSVRQAPVRSVWTLQQAGVHPLLAQLYAARGVHSTEELDDQLSRLIEPSQMLGCAQAAGLLADAMHERRHICIVADYDCDGATACAVALRGLKLLGAAPETVGYVVPDRAIHGYGLTPAIVDLALASA